MYLYNVKYLSADFTLTQTNNVRVRVVSCIPRLHVRNVRQIKKRQLILKQVTYHVR